VSNLVNPYLLAPAGPAVPSTLSSIWEWWEPSRDSYADNDPMGTLTGQFAAKNFTSAGTDRPTFKTNQLNGLAVADVGASVRQGWSGVDGTALTAGHIFLIVKAVNDPGIASRNQLWNIGTVSIAIPDAYPFTDSKVYMGAGSTTRRTCTNPTLSLASWRLLEIITTSTEYTVLLDGTETLFTSGTNAVGFNNSMRLGLSGAGTSWFVGQYAGMYLCSAKLSSGDRTTLINYINSRFGLSAS
jgi:hypothetical protein